MAKTTTNHVAEQGCGAKATKYRSIDGVASGTKSSSDYSEEDYSSSACSISSGSTYYFAGESRTYTIISKSYTYGNGQY